MSKPRVMTLAQWAHTPRAMWAYIEALERRIPHDLAPSAYAVIYQQVRELYDFVDDQDYITREAAQIRLQVAVELEREAASATAVRDFTHAQRLRRQAARFEDDNGHG